MTNGKYVSVHTIIEKAYRDLGLSDDINFGDAVEWIGEAIELIGTPMQLSDKVANIDICSYKGKLPCDLHLITTSRAATGITVEDLAETPCRFTAMRYSTDAFHHHYCNSCKDHGCDSDLTYKVNDNYVFTNFETGVVQMSYKAIPTDKDGFPLVPDDIKFKEGVAGHLKWKIAFIRWANGKMPAAVYQKLEQDRDWYIGAAQNRGHMPSVDQMESIKNNWIRLIPKINQHADSFRSAGHREERYTHNSNASRTPNPSGDKGDTFFNYKDSNNES